MAIAARMPMIATTIISSMRVKPRWFPTMRRFLVHHRIIEILLGFSLNLYSILAMGGMHLRCHRLDGRTTPTSSLVRPPNFRRVRRALTGLGKRDDEKRHITEGSAPGSPAGSTSRQPAATRRPAQMQRTKRA